MTETFTNPVFSAVKKDLLIDDADADDLPDQEKHIYKLIAAKLNLLQISPREKITQKILAYSKTRDNF